VIQAGTNSSNLLELLEGTAIFAGNDHIAHGVYKVLRDRGLRIPEDIRVRGCDDTVGARLRPGLTTIRDFPEQLGKQIVKVIVNRIANPAQSPQHSTIPTELVKKRFMPFDLFFHRNDIECPGKPLRLKGGIG
jgi:DNA-binding LacI/PurR family transcriptional regulator